MAELYLFNNNGEYWPISTSIFKKIFEGRTYLPTKIKRSSIKITSNFSKSDLQFEFERTHPFAANLLINLPEIPVTVIVYGNDGAKTLWRGTVLDVSKSGNIITLSCNANDISLKRPSLQPRIGPLCRHVLYGTACKVNQNLWKSSYSVGPITTNVINVPAIVEASGYFTGGIASINNQNRTIQKHTDATITLSSPFTGVQSGTIDLYPGCNLTEENCIAFNNLENNGSFSRMPLKNPFNGTGLL